MKIRIDSQFDRIVYMSPGKYPSIFTKKIFTQIAKYLSNLFKNCFSTKF